DIHGLIEELLHVHTPTVRKLACSAEDHSGLDVLARAAVPVLIMAGGRDPFAPLPVTAQMHARAPRSEYVQLPEATHTALLDHAPQIGTAVDSFLRRASEPTSAR
ncbi:MAG TPA: alpha/beta hydrolase, partial [Polyangiales bacterium]